MESQILNTVRVNLTRVAVKAYYPYDNRAVFEIFFNDGKKRRMTRSAVLGEPEVLARQLIERLVLKEKHDCVDFDGESLIDVHVLVEDEERAVRMLAGFFRSLNRKAERIRSYSKSEGYLSLLKSLQTAEAGLDGR